MEIGSVIVSEDGGGVTLIVGTPLALKYEAGIMNDLAFFFLHQK